MLTARKKVRKQGRNPKNLSLDPRIIDMGTELANQDRREFSAEVEWLIEQEMKRRQPEGTAA